MQTFISILLLAFAVAYAAWRVYRLLRDRRNPCADCQGCMLKDVRMEKGENRLCEEKKAVKNLAK